MTFPMALAWQKAGHVATDITKAFLPLLWPLTAILRAAVAGGWGRRNREYLSTRLSLKETPRGDSWHHW